MPANTRKLASIAKILYPDADVTHLGTGGFASTFKVEQGGDTFAVKILDPERSDVVRTEREFAALRRVSHKNVVAYRAIDSIEVEEVSYQYVEMDYVDGAPLSKSLRFNDEFDLESAVSIMLQIFEGAAALWREQTTHRDLSPGNIMLTNSGEVVIVDLGLARHIDDETNTMLPTPGTPGWMSPEQVSSSSPQRGDWRSDQYVIGLLAWRLATNVRPFGKVSGFELWSAPGEITIPKAKDANSRVPAKLSSLLEKMTQKQPFKRYLDPNRLLEDARAVAESLNSDEKDLLDELDFYLAIGQIKNIATDDFVKKLGASGLVLDAAGCVARVEEFSGAAADSGIKFTIDPVSYVDRSPMNARSAYYRRLPYGQKDRIEEVFKTDELRSTYCKDILNYQLDSGVGAIISPYFLADPGELHWIDESLSCAQSCRDLLREQGKDIEVWSAVAVSSGVLVGPAREHLLNALTATPLPSLYFLISTSQAPFAPLAEERTLAGLRDVIDAAEAIGTPLIIGRRDTSGLLGLSLGASGWSTGVSAKLENLPRHLEEPDDSRGGQAVDRYYVPELLNSVRLGTRARLRRAKLLEECYTEYDKVLFSSGRLIAQVSTTDQRVLLKQHNIQAKCDQVAELSSLDRADRREWMKDKVHHARQLYSKIPGIVDQAESGAFLEVWKKFL